MSALTRCLHSCTGRRCPTLQRCGHGPVCGRRVCALRGVSDACVCVRLCRSPGHPGSAPTRSLRGRRRRGSGLRLLGIPGRCACRGWSLRCVRTGRAAQARCQFRACRSGRQRPGLGARRWRPQARAHLSARPLHLPRPLTRPCRLTSPPQHRWSAPTTGLNGQATQPLPALPQGQHAQPQLQWLPHHAWSSTTHALAVTGRRSQWPPSTLLSQPTQAQHSTPLPTSRPMDLAQLLVMST